MEILKLLNKITKKEYNTLIKILKDQLHHEPHEGIEIYRDRQSHHVILLKLIKTSNIEYFSRAKL